MVTDHVISELRANALFASLTETEFSSVLDGIHVHELAKGALLFRQNQSADRFFFVSRGQVKLSVFSAEGEEKVIEVIASGRTFAEAIMFMPRHSFPVTATALTDAVVCSIAHAHYLPVLEGSRDACFRLLGDISRRLHDRISEIESLTLQNASHRLVRYLLRALPDGAADGAVIDPGVSRQVIASQLSIQPETLSRLLRSLCDYGVVEVTGREIRVLNLDALRAF